MSEFKEPWEAKEDCGWFGLYDRSTEDFGPHRLIFVDPETVDFPSELRERMARVAACVNACAGIPTADLDRASRFLPTLAASLTAEQKSELLSKLEAAEPSEVVAIPTGMEYRPAPLTWRKEPPDRGGWWWRLDVSDRDPWPDIVRASWDGCDGEILCIEDFYETNLSIPASEIRGSLWAGPIEPPEVPE